MSFRQVVNQSCKSKLLLFHLFFFVPISELLAGIDVVEAVHVEVVLAVEVGSSDERNFVSDHAGDRDEDHEPAGIGNSLMSIGKHRCT